MVQKVRRCRGTSSLVFGVCPSASLSWYQKPGRTWFSPSILRSVYLWIFYSMVSLLAGGKRYVSVCMAGRVLLHHVHARDSSFIDVDVSSCPLG